ncbi:DDE Tnp4 domain-containing protein [Trichonephila clavipes]|nr:DDE Tnp4 domain-containing protein [Trichonephila clavipes]
MPAFLDKQAQLSTEDANETRLVASIRWVVEAWYWARTRDKASHGPIPIPLGYRGHEDYVKVVCLILNAFHPARLYNIEDDNTITQRMLDFVKKPNYLQQTFEENGRARKMAIWTSLNDSELPDFLRLTWKELRYLTLGIYQLKQSQSYIHEHLDQSGLKLSLRK